MTNKLIKTLSVLLMFIFCTSSAYAKDSMFGERDEWLTAEKYIDDVFKYDYETFDDDSQSSEENLGSYSRAITDCKLLGIMTNEESGNFEPNKIVKKNELAAVLIRMLHNDSSLISEFVKNYSNEADATVSDAAAVMVEALGYSNQIKQYEENGAMLVAAKLKVFKNMEQPSGNALLTKEVLAAFVYNTLSIDIMVETGFANNEIVYERKKGATILTEYMNVTPIDGFLDAVYGLNIYSSEKIPEGYVSIDRVQYMTDDNYSDLFAGRVHGYARYDELRNKYRIIGIAASDDCSPTVTYSAYDCYAEGGSIKIDNDEKKIKYPLSAVKHFMYNGDYKPVNELAGMLSGNISGLVRLSASESNGNYDTVLIKDFNSFALQSVSSEDGLFILKNGVHYNGNGYIKLSDDIVANIRDNNGEIITLDKIKANSVLDFYQNSDATYCEAVITRDSIEGAIVATADDKYILDNGLELHMAPSALEAVANGKLNKLNIGDRGDFYVSVSEDIVDYAVSDSIRWGYLREVGTFSSDAFTSGTAARIFSSSGDWITVDFADKVEIDGVKSIKAADAYTLIKSKNGEDNLVRYKLNSENLLTFLDTVSDEPEESAYNDRIALADNFNGEANWSKGYSWSDCPMHIVPQTTIFIIPGNKSKEKHYKIETNTYFQSGEKYNIDFYTPDNMLKCKAAIVSGSSGSSDSSNFVGSTLIAVQSVIRSIDEEENDRTIIKGLLWKNRVSEVRLTISDVLTDDDEAVKPEVGCVYRYKMVDDEITELELISDKGLIRDMAVNTGKSYEVMCGTVLDCETNYIKLRVDGVDWVWDVTAASYVLYDRQNGKFKQISISDIYNGDRICLIGAVEYGGAVLIVR